MCVVMGCHFPVILRQTREDFIFLKLGLLLNFLDNEASTLIANGQREMTEFVIH